MELTELSCEDLLGHKIMPLYLSSHVARMRKLSRTSFKRVIIPLMS
jgi:hypothetical protein